MTVGGQVRDQELQDDINREAAKYYHHHLEKQK